jgi:hypothetical protein
MPGPIVERRKATLDDLRHHRTRQDGRSKVRHNTQELTLRGYLDTSLSLCNFAHWRRFAQATFEVRKNTSL